MKPRLLLLVAIPLVAVILLLVFRGSLNAPDDTIPPPIAPSTVSASERDSSALDPRESGEDSPGEERVAAGVADLTDPGDAASPAERVVWSGRVIDPAGNPLPEAQVKLVEDSGRHYGQGMTWNFSGADAVAEGVSDARGRFLLEREGTPGPLQIVALKAGFQVFHDEAKERELGDLVLEPGMILNGFVLSSSGKPVAEARVRRPRENRGLDPFVIDFGPWMDEDDDPQPGEVLTDAKGRFELPHEAPGPYRLQARHPQHPRAEVQGEGREGESLEEHIVLPRAASISGSVAGIPAEIEAELRVLARRVKSAGEKANQRGNGALFFPGSENFDADRSARIAEDGSFLLEGLFAGERYELWACQEKESLWNLETCSARVSAAAGSVGVALRFQLGCQLRFQVIDASTSEPLEDLVIQHEWKDEGYGFFGLGDRETTREYEAGRVVIDQLRPPSTSGALQLVVRSPGHRKHEQEITVPEEGSLELGQIRLSASAQLAFTVRDADGLPVGRARIALRNAGGHSWGGGASEREEVDAADVTLLDIEDTGGISAQDVLLSLNPALAAGVTDQEGRCVVDLPDATEADLRITAREFATYEEENLSLPLVGTREKAVTLSRGGGVRILVLDATGNPSADTPVEHHENRTRRTDQEGRIELSRLAPGSHYFRLEEPRGESSFIFLIGEEDLSAWTPAEVREGAVAELVLTKKPQGVLTGKVIEGGQPLRNARLALTPDEESSGNDVNDLLRSMEGLGDLVSGRGSASATTDRDGRFSFEGRDIGAYTLKVSHPDREMSERYAVTLIEGTNVFDVNLPLTIVAGRVTDEEGRPVEGASVSARRGDGESNPLGALFINGSGLSLGTGTGSKTLTDADGNYELRGVASDEAFTLVIDAEGLIRERSEVLELPANTRRDDVDFILTRGVSLTVVVPASSSPDRIVALEREGESSRIRQVEGDEVHFDGLAPGTWTVALRGDSSFAGYEEVVLEKGREHRIVLDGKVD